MGRFLFNFLITVFRILPHRAALALGGFLGWLLRLALWKKTDRAEARCVLALGVGVTAARGIVKRSFVNFGRSAAEFARMDRLMPRIRELVALERLEVFQEALSRGRGALLITGHIGNWEMAGARMEAEGYHLTTLYTQQRNQGGFNDFISHQHEDVVGMRMVKSDSRGDLRELFRALRARGVVVLLQDLDARRDGIPVPFLGLPASTHEGIVKLHRKFGSPVLPALHIRAPDGVHHRVVFGEVLSDQRDEDGNPFGADIAKSLRMCNAVLEGWVRAYPDQWLWLLDRWESTLGKR